jgi:hypothetical protein
MARKALQTCGYQKSPPGHAWYSGDQLDSGTFALAARPTRAPM